MNTIKINYDKDKDKTTIKFSNEFNSLPPQQQLTAVTDGLSALYKRFSALFNNIDDLWGNYQRLRDRSKLGKDLKGY